MTMTLWTVTKVKILPPRVEVSAWRLMLHAASGHKKRGTSGNGIMALIKQVEAVKVEQEMREGERGLFMTRGILCRRLGKLDSMH